ncbi:MAG: excinuclease ABC subunit UvrC [Acholeplasmatales bacterium]|nr:excinuclease ABC subunit UvrC [Acholeplasmatales bacterium]
MSIIEEKLKLLPSSPGSYQMLDKNGTIIYVGKAKNLKNRVRSYFHGKHNSKTNMLVSEIADFKYVITSTEQEAFVLEINLIKQYDPKYNILLRDDKTYPYIALTNEKYPRLIVTRNKRKKGYARYFGPYPNVQSARSTCDLLNRLYPLRKCKNIPDKTCLYYSMNMCLAPCINKDVDYSKYRSEIASFLNGNFDNILKELNNRMSDYSNNMEFEKAIEYRNLIEDIKKTTLRQKIAINDLTSRDYIAIYESDDEVSINIIITRLGNIVQNHETILDLYGDLNEVVIPYLESFYDQNDIPKEICIEGIDVSMLKEIIDTNFVDFKLGKKKELYDMALYNAKFNLENKRNIYRNTVLKKIETIKKLGELLNINTPNVIEAFDNSNLYGEYPVSGMVCYVNGKACPKLFRKYHIKTVVGANDFESMKEVVRRRYKRLKDENGTMPDLIVMDGGQIQVHACLEVLKEIDVNIPVMGIQKDDHHKATIIFYDEKLIPLSKNDPIFILLSDISQRVHDYAISFFRSEKGKGIFSSILDGIDGLGPKRKEELLKYFETIENIKNASIEDLIAAKMPKNLAGEIYNHFHEN